MRLRSNIPYPVSPRIHPRGITLRFAKFAVVLGVTGFLWLLVLTGTAHAAGGVGDGGSGSGGGGGHQSRYGWGWVVYATDGPGPTDGFRNGARWTNAQSTCRNANAKTVYAHIVYDDDKDGRIYDYPRSWSEPYVFANHFPPGISADNRRATTISTGTAEGAFNNLGSYGVDTRGYRFGDNVGWFCYDFSPSVDINAHAYRVSDEGAYLGEVSDVQVHTCQSPGDVTRSDSGFVTFQIPDKGSFCVRIISVNGRGNTSIPGYDGPFIRPWSEGYGKDLTCPGRTGPPFTGQCLHPSYEWQAAGVDAKNGGYGYGFNFYDRNWDGGYDFVYIRKPLSCTPPPAPSRINTDIKFEAQGGTGVYTWTKNEEPESGGGIIRRGPRGRVDGTGSSFTTRYSSVGTYSVTVRSGELSAPCEVIVTDDPPPPPPPPPLLPYFRAYNSDIIAGSQFPDADGNCVAKESAGILAFNRGIPDGIGAGTELAAMAMNQIYGFSSAAMRNSAANPPKPLKGLTFSSTAGDGAYGGDFGSAPCMRDYDKEPIKSGYRVDTTLPAGPIPNVPLGDRHVVKVIGDIFITSNIEYVGSGGWASLEQIPSLYVIAVGGNIYIGPGVSKLDGVYIAQPNGAGAGGTIFTCADTASPPTYSYTAATLADNCDNNQLLVNGVFIAKTIKLQRTKGDMNAGAADERHDSGNLAEIFRYSPELFFASPFFTAAPYQSLNNLPPVL